MLIRTVGNRPQHVGNRPQHQRTRCWQQTTASAHTRRQTVGQHVHSAVHCLEGLVPEHAAWLTRLKHARVLYTLYSLATPPARSSALTTASVATPVDAAGLSRCPPSGAVSLSHRGQCPLFNTLPRWRLPWKRCHGLTFGPSLAGHLPSADRGSACHRSRGR